MIEREIVYIETDMLQVFEYAKVCESAVGQRARARVHARTCLGSENREKQER